MLFVRIWIHRIGVLTNEKKERWSGDQHLAWNTGATQQFDKLTVLSEAEGWVAPIGLLPGSQSLQNIAYCLIIRVALQPFL